MSENVVHFPSKVILQINDVAQEMIQAAVKVAHSRGYVLAQNPECMLDLELIYEMMIGTVTRYKNLNHPIMDVMDELTGMNQETD